MVIDKVKVLALAAKKRPSSKTSNYLISVEKSNINKNNNNIIAKLREIKAGYFFILFSNGENP